MKNIRSKLKRGERREKVQLSPNWSSFLVRKKKKNCFTYGETKGPPPATRKNRGMEVPVIGIPLRRAIRAIRDAAWKQIRRGKVCGGRGGESQRERELERILSLFFILRVPPLPHWVNTVLSVPFFQPPFVLSFFPFPVYAGQPSIRFRSRPSSRSVFSLRSSACAPACAQSLLSIFLEFSSIGSSNFLSIYLFTLFGNQILFGEVEIFHLEIKEIGKK